MGEKRNVQKPEELNDAQLEQSSGGEKLSEIKVQSTCPRCGRGSGVVLRTVFKCPYCGYQEAYVM